MAGKINPKYEFNRFCIECGYPLWMTETPIKLKGRNKWGSSDIPDDSAEGYSREGSGMGWIHVFPYICDRCNKAFTYERTLSQPTPETVFPDDYRLMGELADNRPDSMKTDQQAG